MTERDDALEEAALIADFYAAENFRLAQDTILLDPVLRSRGADQSPEALALSEKLRVEGCVHSSMAHSAQYIAAEIRKRVAA